MIGVVWHENERVFLEQISFVEHRVFEHDAGAGAGGVVAEAFVQDGGEDGDVSDFTDGDCADQIACLLVFSG